MSDLWESRYRELELIIESMMVTLSNEKKTSRIPEVLAFPEESLVVASGLEPWQEVRFYAYRDGVLLREQCGYQNSLSLTGEETFVVVEFLTTPEPNGVESRREVVIDGN